MASSLILHIPHASSLIPDEDKRRSFLLNEEQIQSELIAMTDWYTDEMFDHGLGKAVIAPVSRLVCDVERFSHDEEEPMAQCGMGFCYERGSYRQPIKRCLAAYKDEVLWRYYAPHHIALTDSVATLLQERGQALILDCHSFSPYPLPYEPRQGRNRPEICIGTDSYHTPVVLKEMVERFFTERGFKVKFNNPYGGSLVPLRYYQKEKRVLSLMVEVNRRLYLEPGTSQKNSGFGKLCGTMEDLEKALLAYTKEKGCA